MSCARHSFGLFGLLTENKRAPKGGNLFSLFACLRPLSPWSDLMRRHGLANTGTPRSQSASPSQLATQTGADFGPVRLEKMDVSRRNFLSSSVALKINKLDPCKRLKGSSRSRTDERASSTLGERPTLRLQLIKSGLLAKRLRNEGTSSSGG